MFGERGKLITRVGTLVVDTATTGVLDAVSDQAVVDCGDLSSIVVLGNAITPSTTVTMVFEISYDGINWLTAGANATISNFAAANTAYALPQSDTHGMPLPIKKARVTLTVFTGVGSYSFAVVGYQRPGYA
jgi:hypothetical protein